MEAMRAEPGRRRLTAAIAMAGGAAVTAGAALPWLTVFSGLHSYPGIAGLNGQVLAAGGAAAMLLAVWYAARGQASLRYAIGALGFALALFSAYLMTQLLVTYRALQGMFIPALGPGVFVSTAGALLLIATLLGGPRARQHQPPASRLDGRLAALIALSAGAGTIHLAVAAAHLHEYWLFGAFFAALGTAQAAWAILAAIHGPSQRLLIAATGNAAVVALWAASRTTGLPLGPHPGTPETLGFPDITATLFEAVLVGCAAWSLRHQGPRPGAQSRGWPGRSRWPCHQRPSPPSSPPWEQPGTCDIAGRRDHGRRKPAAAAMAVRLVPRRRDQ